MRDRRGLGKCLEAGRSLSEEQATGSALAAAPPTTPLFPANLSPSTHTLPFSARGRGWGWTPGEGRESKCIYDPAD